MHSDADSIAAAPVSELEPGLDQVQDPIQTAELYCTQSRWSEAIALCQQALEQQPNRVEAYVTWGNAQQAQGEIDRAIASYQAALRQDPRCSRAWVNLGSMFYRQGQLTQAISHYRQAISLDPDLTAAYWNLVLALKQQGLLDEAQVVAQQARDLKVRQQDAVALLVQGKQLAAQGNLEAALNCWQKAVALKPDGVEAYCQIGMALRHQGQASQGISWLEQALKLQPDCIPAHQQLCSILRDSGHFEAARTAVHQYSVLCGEQDPIMTAIYFISTCQVSGLNQIARSRLLELEARLESSMAQLTAIEIKALYANLLFSLPYLRDHLEQNFRLQQKIATAYANQISQPPSLTTGYALKSGRDPLGKPLKIGLISNHYNRHSVGWCSADIVGGTGLPGGRNLSRIAAGGSIETTGLSNLNR
ncbi:MAG: tetratricopeptide repeat protein [Oscillatoriales cyanobacterium RM1_1_9]|nr:tetratricopeptide repeat protein [Oscillatoriales cyanobacterium RM1_1_9]